MNEQSSKKILYNKSTVSSITLLRPTILISRYQRVDLPRKIMLLVPQAQFRDVSLTTGFSETYSKSVLAKYNITTDSRVHFCVKVSRYRNTQTCNEYLQIMPTFIPPWIPRSQMHLETLVFQPPHHQYCHL